MKNAIAIVAAALCAAAAPHAEAQAPCSTPGYDRMDFWLGDWALSFTGQDGKPAEAISVISKIEGGCVIDERFDGAASIDFTGRSWSVYDPAADLWRQTWVDATGSYLLFEEGPAQDADFALIQTNVPPEGPYWRMIWTDVGADALTWTWQSRVEAGAPWTDVWIIRYKRQN